MSDDSWLSAHVYISAKRLIAGALCPWVVFVIRSRSCCHVFLGEVPNVNSFSFFLPVLSWSYSTENKLSQGLILTASILGASWGKRLEKLYIGMWPHFQYGFPLNGFCRLLSRDLLLLYPLQRIRLQSSPGEIPRNLSKLPDCWHRQVGIRKFHWILAQKWSFTGCCVRVPSITCMMLSILEQRGQFKMEILFVLEIN